MAVLLTPHAPFGWRSVLDSQQAPLNAIRWLSRIYDIEVILPARFLDNPSKTNTSFNLSHTEC